jgi:hypothetical protein
VGIRFGFTIVELLTTTAVIGVLIATLLPAVQAAREASRRTECQNNLRSVATALLVHHSTLRVFPSGGWGHEWTGVPTRGSGRRQPGSWAYSILHYAEQGDLHSLGSEATGVFADKLYSARLMTPLELLTCPTRRRSSPWPISSSYPYMRNPRPFGAVDRVARSDYAINSGTSHVFRLGGPSSLVEGDSDGFWLNRPQANGFSGISHLRIATTIDGIIDGTSRTYLVGEKHVEAAFYFTGESKGDNDSLYSGYSTDLHRFAGIIESLKVGKSPFVPPLNDQVKPNSDLPSGIAFGSAHFDGFNMAYCDGSLKFIGYDVDAEVHFRSAHRRDRGERIEELK